MKKHTVVLLVLAAALLGYGIGVGQPYLLRGPLVVGQDAVVPGVSARVDVAEAGGKVLVVDPPTGEARVAFVLYGGGLVRPQAYEWIGQALAAHGVRTLIPEMPLDLAVLGEGRAEKVAAELAPDLPVVLGGHSLGGAMAASYAADHADAIAGLVLLASYPADSADLSSTALPTLSLRAELDGVADAAKVKGGLSRLPESAELVTIDGAVHSFFGRYGPQAGDGIPTVTRAVAEAQIAEELTRFFAGID